ncbi:LuxR C-terminal-related transcriptional regulator [Oceanobacillus halotolerans]|uniref:LuxR C-terminal-related transcriptional regulator n=1 Tax=Oceanobacillus halotolerans TaxID=2663380 RepID=UPI0013D93C54|nr:LuxR C-terminal-related transcriptional regulator [Oceanobacillus halotolerans]
MDFGEQKIGTQPEDRIDSFLSYMEGDTFVGRDEELEWFKNQLQSQDPIRLLHLHGPGGVGKTYLLNEYHRIAEQLGIIFIQLDSQDFSHTTESFLEHLLFQLETHTDIEVDLETISLRKTFRLLKVIPVNQPIIISIDSYEYMDSLDRWFREMFVRNMPSNIHIILSGRQPLSNEWIASPAWRKVVKEMELGDFSFSQTRRYLANFNINQKENVQTLWQFTKGHPLTLSLATIIAENQNEFDTTLLTKESSQILMELTKQWLKEVKEEDMHEYVEAAAMLNRFDQSILSIILKRDVPLKVFQALTSLSFVKPTKQGWGMHELIRDAIRMELKHRNPDWHQLLNERSAAYFYKKTLATRSPLDVASFFYHLGDEFIQSVFFQESIDTSMYLEPVGEYNIHEVTEFFQKRKQSQSESEAQFYNRQTNQSYRFYASLAHNQKELEILDDHYVRKIDYKGTNLLKNKHGITVGLIIIVPINKDTLQVLMEEPISRAYFKQLSEKERKEYAAEPSDNAGYFIRLFDYLDPADTAARSFTLYSLFPLLLTGGKIIASTPLPFFKELLENFGFDTIPEATHYDYGEDNPSTTYFLDVRGPKLATYLQHLTNSLSSNSKQKVLQETFSLTDREVDIVTLILEEKTNAAIAKELYIAEITVKKHISRIFHKVQVKNRSQLIKRIMELM